MSRVHDALRRAEQSGGLPPVITPPEMTEAAPPASPVGVATASAPASSPLSGGILIGPDFLSRVRHAVLAIAGFAPDRYDEAARGPGGGVPDASHSAESPSDPPTDSHSRSYEPITSRRQVLRGRQPRGGRGATGRQPNATGRLRLPATYRSQPFPGRTLTGPYGLPYW